MRIERCESQQVARERGAPAPPVMMTKLLSIEYRSSGTTALANRKWDRARLCTCCPTSDSGWASSGPVGQAVHARDADKFDIYSIKIIRIIFDINIHVDDLDARKSIS